MKKTISFLIAICIMLSLVVPALAVTPVTAKVYDQFQNNMLFQQNDEANIAGTAQSGSRIEVYLYTKDHTLVTSSETQSRDGKFIVTFNAPKGSFDEYTVVLKENGMTFKTLTGVVFGELWLASGQSNMELYMKLCSTWEEYQKNGYGSKWVRVISIPNYPAYENTDTTIPLTPQLNVPGANWARACDPDIDIASAVAVYFAHKLMENLNVPIGILNATLGGSRIESWLSRDTIENDEFAFSTVKNSSLYWTEDTWIDHEADSPESFNDWTGKMSTNFNGRLSPLRYFKIKGMIWYQGEANMGWAKEVYAYFLNMMVEQNTALFNYQGGKLPIIYSQLASYDYGNENVYMQDFNYGLAMAQKQNPDNMACISIYDLPLTFSKNYFTIHPLDKKPIGIRMAETALKLVYGEDGVYTSALMNDVTIDGSDVYVKFENVGDGLATKNNDEVRGFALCGSDGVYCRADAEIVSSDTVRVSSESVVSPVSVTYAYYYLNDRANLYSTNAGKLVMPVTAFISNYDYQKNIYCDFGWADCESEQIWKNVKSSDVYNDKLTGFYDSWDTSLCSYKISPSSAYKGSAGLNVKSFSKIFSISQNNVIKKFNEKTGYVTSQDKNWSKYGVLKFMVKNNGILPVTINCEITSENVKYCPALNGSVNTSYVIKNDGEWHEVEMNLGVMFENGKTDKAVDSSVLTQVTGFEVTFSSMNIKANVDVDEFNFASHAELSDNNSQQSKGIFDIVLSIYRKLFSLIF